MINGEFYFTSLLLGFPRRLVVARKPIFRLTVCNELKLLSATVCTLVIDSLDKEALGNRVGSLG